MDQQLQVFVTVSEKKNFSRAAEVLHMTQPAVSQYIKQFETEIGTRLLERNNKGVKVTKAGELVLHHVKEMLAIYSRMNILLDDLMEKAAGPLAIGASYTFGEYVLPECLAMLQQKYPEIEPSVFIGNTKNVSDRTANRQLDIGVVEGEVENPKLTVEKLTDDQMRVVVPSSHPLADKTITSLAKLKDETWIVREEGSGTREMTDKMFVERGFVPKKTMTFGSTQIIKEAVEAGIGVTFLSNWVIHKEMKLGTLKPLNVEGFPFIRPFSLIKQATPYQTKAVEVFSEMLSKKF